MNDEEQLELDIPEVTLTEEGLEEDVKKNLDKANKDYQEATKGNEEIRRLREARRGTGVGDTQLDIPGIFEARSGLRTTAALGTEIFLNTLVDPLFEPTTQVAAGTAINFLAQRIRGGEMSYGELTAAGLASLIPGGAQGRAVTQFAKGAGRGALSGAIETAGIAGIDRGELPTIEELGLGLGMGAAFGGAISTPQATKAIQNLRGRVLGQFTPIEVFAMGRKKKIVPSPGQGELDLTYAELNKTIKKPLTEADLTPEEKVRYAQQNADDIDLDSYLEQMGAETVTRKPLRIRYVKPFQAKYGASDEQVKRYVRLTNRKIKDVKKTISYLNFEYKVGLPTAEIEDVAADMSLLFRQDITPETIDAIIKGQGGKVLFQTDGMKARGEDPFEITDRESLLKVYLSRLDLLNKHGAFDKGHVYAADQLLRDNNVSSVDMYNNLEPEIRASIQQLVEPIEIEQLINGQITKNKDYIEVIIGNRSKKAGSDPADKVFERLYGKSYGLEEDFRNFLFPDQDIANMVHNDLKPFFGKLYVRKVKQIVKEREGIGPVKNKVGSHSLNFIREQAMKEVLEDFVADGTIIKSDAAYQESLANIQNMFDFLLGRRMVNPKTNEADRGDIDDGGYEKTLDEVLGEL